MLDRKIWNSAPYPFDRGGWAKSISTGKSSASASHAQLESAKAAAGWDGKDQTYAHHFSSLPRDSRPAYYSPSSHDALHGVQKNILASTIKKHSSISERIFAAKANKVELLQSMLDADPGTRLEDADNLGRTILHASAASGCLEVTSFLCARCSTQAKPSNQLAERAYRASITQQSSSNRLEVGDLMEWGSRGPGSKIADRRQRTQTSLSFLNLRDHAGDTALHLAAAQGNNDIVELLYCQYHLLEHLMFCIRLSRGVEVEVRNFAGRTALHLACLNCNLDCIKTLMEGGANARMRDREGRRPLDMSDEPLVHALLREKAGNEVAVRGGPTPFGWGDHDTYVDANLTGLDKLRPSTPNYDPRLGNWSDPAQADLRQDLCVCPYWYSFTARSFPRISAEILASRRNF
uniref:Uncharacterized protein n=1 Tax=Guillardia theta TaxID=55529 RepID=A0A7S4P4R7_GUITH|mmetsp:Transcript_43104/g.136182  ORF Transcript_43104/g.136182 Transcript_43104/m.136182 type:complete len:406 (+) Transcript_43104:334-1551(+)